ncbi:MAG: flagellar GTP-binding protein [Opitutaceae bacterium]|jgi:flagellar biosynthesis protein FlhF
MSAIATPESAAPGTYRFEVGSAAEAVEVIRGRLGPEARVLSVNGSPRRGLGRFFGAPRFEVVAELPQPPPPPAPEPEPAGRAPLALTEGARLPFVLRKAGFPERLIGRLESSPGWSRALGRPLHEALADLSRDLRAAARPAKPLPDRIAFLGAAGVGRTTALCKWLSHEVFTRGRMGRVWHVEFERPNPAPALDVFCEALGIPVEHYAPGGDPVAPGEFLLADLPGLPGAGSREARELTRFLDREHIAGRVLVLNAAYDAEALRSAYARGRDFGATHLVCTHLDETPRWGRLWEFLLEGELSPLFLSTGPGLTGELDADVLGLLLARTLPLRGEEDRS